MKYFYLIALFLTSALWLEADESSLKLPLDTCSQYHYGYTIGATMYTKSIQKKKIEKEAEKLSGHTQEEALAKLQKSHPDLGLISANMAIKNCYVYIRALSADHIYYFDAKNLALQETKKR